MKIIYTFLFAFLIANTINAQDRFLTKSGEVNFFSSSPMEDITADNKQVLSIVDNTNGKMAISILMKSFQFEKALMQEHFNENYVESDKYPKATFKGNILDYSSLKSGDKAKVKGIMTIHGVSKEMTIEADFTKSEENITMKGEFMIPLKDFKIEIPAVVAKNIAKEIKVSFNFNHTPYKR